jgi:TonB family protein
MVTPCYPEDALRAGAQGRVTSVVRFDEGGNLVLIKILESPHLSISRAVIDAVRQWRIKRLFHAGGEPTRIISELRFHYLIKDGKGRVENSSVEEQTSFSEKFTKVMNEETRKFRPEEPTAKPNR